MPKTTFDDLDDYVEYPRLIGLAASPAGDRVVVTCQTADNKAHKYVTALWDVDPEGVRPARRLTRSAKGEGGAVVADDGSVYFISARPDTDPDTPEDTPVLWQLPPNGEARVFAARGNGFGNLLAARDADVLVAVGGVLPRAKDLDDDERLAKLRKESGVAAIHHTQYPIRYWDHDIGPATPHYLVVSSGTSENDPVKPALETPKPQFRDLVPDAGHALVEVGADLTPDGKTLVTGWGTQVGSDVKESIVAIDVATGERHTVAAYDDSELSGPAVNAAGKVAFIRMIDGYPGQAQDNQLWVCDLGGGNARRVAPEWDRWPEAVTWHPTKDGLLVLANEDGACALFYIDLDGDKVLRVTSEVSHLMNLHVARDGSRAFALQSSYLWPDRPVVIDLAGAIDGWRSVESQPLLSPVPDPELPGTLEVFYPTADDGAPIRTMVFLPEGASADNPAPLLLWIHGGPLMSWNSWSWRWNPWNMVAKGYALALPDPGLSVGYGHDFVKRGWAAWGQRPFTDLMAATDAVVARPDIDETRTAAMGGSFGGYMANWTAGHTDRFKCIVTHASLWDLDQFGPTTDMASYWDKEFPPGPNMEANSPGNFVADIRTPLLVIHGNNDYRVPISEGLRLWYELLTHSGLPMDESGKSPHEFLLFPNENHWVLTPHHAKVWYSVVYRFLAKHVLGEDLPLPEELG
jgi:dipeptidyl aminopeptidase/acylaminoacyl peptidase